MIFDILAGFFSGLTASMGLGGGFVLMIFLTVFKGYNQIYSQAINLMFFIPIAIFSINLNGEIMARITNNNGQNIIAIIAASSISVLYLPVL